MTMWCAVNTLPNQEMRANTNLLQQGFRPWLPTMKRSRRHARRIDTITTPVFPGYLFVELDPDREAWLSINGTFGVRRLLCHNKRPARVPATFISALQETIDNDGSVSVPEDNLKPGQKVRLISGPFVDCVGTLMYLAAKDRVALLLSVLGSQVSTVVPRSSVAPAS